MKKLFRKALLFVSIISMGAFSVSCDSKTISAIFNNLIKLQGTTYTYSGNGTVQELILQSDGESYQYGNATPSKFTGSVVLTVNNTLAELTIPSMTVNGASMSQVKFYNLAMQSTNNATKLDVGDSTSADGTLTVDGTTYSVSNVYIETAVTSQSIAITILSIYFGDNNEYAINITYTGTAQATE